MKKLKIGLVGCGGIANNKHMPALSKLSDKCEMVAFCDIIVERAEKAAKEYGTPDAKVYTDYNELLANPDVDVVHVLTPNVAHRPITVAAFEAGKHVMCEKPMAHTSADAQAMLDAWRKSGKKFTIGYQNRFRPEVQMLHQCCENDELGEIYFAKAHAIRRRAVPTWGVFPNKALQGGGSAFAQKAPEYEFTVIKENPVTSVKNQYRSGTCWCYSALSFVESEILRTKGIETDLSEMFVVGKSYRDRAVKYVRLDGSLRFAAGSSFGDVLHVINDYGIVPQEAMPGMNYGTELPEQNELDAVLFGYVDAVAKNPNRKLTTAWLNGLTVS